MMTTKKQLIEDAREAAQDNDWIVAAELYRAAGDETSARCCEQRVVLDEEEKRASALAVEQYRQDTIAILQSVARFLGR